MNVYDWGFVGGRGGGGYPHEPTQLILMINKSEQQAKKKILKIASSQPKATGGKILEPFTAPDAAFRLFRTGQKSYRRSQVIFPPPPRFPLLPLWTKRSQSFFSPRTQLFGVPNRAKKLSSGLRSFFRSRPRFPLLPLWTNYRRSQVTVFFFAPEAAFRLFQTGQKSYRRVSGHFFALAPAFRFFRTGQKSDRRPQVVLSAVDATFACLLTKPTLPPHGAFCLHQTHWTKSFFVWVQVPGSGNWGLGLTFYLGGNTKVHHKFKIPKKKFDHKLFLRNLK